MKQKEAQFQKIGDLLIGMSIIRWFQKKKNKNSMLSDFSKICSTRGCHADSSLVVL